MKVPLKFINSKGQYVGKPLDSYEFSRAGALLAMYFRTYTNGLYYYGTAKQSGDSSSAILEFAIPVKNSGVEGTPTRIQNVPFANKDQFPGMLFGEKYEAYGTSHFSYLCSAITEEDSVANSVQEGQLHWKPIIVTLFSRDAANLKNPLKANYDLPTEYQIEMLMLQPNQNLKSLPAPSNAKFLVFGKPLPSPVTDDILQFIGYQTMLETKIDWNAVKGEAGSLRIFLRMSATKTAGQSGAPGQWRRYIVSESEQFLTAENNKVWGTLQGDTINVHLSDVAVPARVDPVLRKITIEKNASPVPPSQTDWQKLLKEVSDASKPVMTAKSKILTRRTLATKKGLQETEGDIYVFVVEVNFNDPKTIEIFYNDQEVSNVGKSNTKNEKNWFSSMIGR